MQKLLLTTPFVLLALGGCDDRLDGRDQPNPYADQDGTVAVQTSPRPSATSAPAAAAVEPGDEPGEDEVSVEGGDDYYDGPQAATGFDPLPMDDAAGFDPTPQQFGNAFDDSDPPQD